MNLSVWAAHAAEAYGLNLTGPALALREQGEPVVRVDAAQGSFVLKGVRADGRAGFRHLNAEELERQGVWAEAMAREGLPVALRLRSRSGRYSASLDDAAQGWLTTLERFAPGEEFACRDLEDVGRIGELLGRLHVAALRSGIRFGHGTSWSLFGDRSTEELGDYDENAESFEAAESALAQGGCPQERSDSIRAAYASLRAELRPLWPELPRAAVQGDLCPYNLTRGEDGGIAGLFDLNIAGDEVLVGELGALLAYYAAYRPEGTSAEAAMLAFYRAYAAVRPLESEERRALEPLLRLLAPFRFDRVARGKRGISADGPEAAARFADETLALLRFDYGFLSAAEAPPSCGLRPFPPNPVA